MKRPFGKQKADDDDSGQGMWGVGSAWRACSRPIGRGIWEENEYIYIMSFFSPSFWGSSDSRGRITAAASSSESTGEVVGGTAI